LGCGRTSLFGLLLEVEEVAPGAVAGRCFIKQDHQGVDGGRAHDGVLASRRAAGHVLARKYGLHFSRPGKAISHSGSASRGR
jgi:hypothetical protein